MFQKRLVSILILVALVIALGATTSVSRAQDKVKLTWLTHWGAADQLKGEQAIIDEYQKANPNITIDLQTVDFGELLTKIVTARTAGTSPDVYHFYNLWIPDFVNSGTLATPPDDIIAAVQKNTPAGVQQGVTANGKIWGYPTEVNTYLLVYNKKVLKAAGFDNPPKTWDEMKKMAAAITKKDSTGAVTQVGYAVMPGWDSGMVHPFAALLFANGGDYLSKDLSTAAFNSPQGVETLQFYLDMVKNGGIDMSINGLTDFPNGKVGMIIMANWWKTTLQTGANIDYNNDVGVAEIPVGPSGKQTSTISYNWILGVDSKSTHQKEAWDFIRWLNTPRAEGKGSPMGEYLTHTLGAIPSSLFDQTAYAEQLNDFFETPFVKSTTYARPEPVVAGGQEIKTKLQTELESVLTSGGDAKATLDSLATDANSILKEKAQSK